MATRKEKLDRARAAWDELRDALDDLDEWEEPPQLINRIYVRIKRWTRGRRQDRQPRQR